MDVQENYELARRFADRKSDRHTRRDLLRHLDAFLDAVLSRSAAGYAIGQDVLAGERLHPFHFDPKLYTSANLQLMQEVRDLYRNPRRFLAADRLKRFFDLAFVDRAARLPIVFDDGARKAAWFYSRQPGYWTTVLGNLIPEEGPRYAPEPGRMIFGGSGGPAGSALPVARIAPPRRDFYRNMMRTVRVFGRTTSSPGTPCAGSSGTLRRTTVG